MKDTTHLDGLARALTNKGLDPTAVISGHAATGPAEGIERLTDLPRPTVTHDLHQDLALRLTSVGVAVWKEKPYALTLDHAIALAARDVRVEESADLTITHADGCAGWTPTRWTCPCCPTSGAGLR